MWSRSCSGGSQLHENRKWSYRIRSCGIRWAQNAPKIKWMHFHIRLSHLISCAEVAKWTRVEINENATRKMNKSFWSWTSVNIYFRQILFTIVCAAHIPTTIISHSHSTPSRNHMNARHHGNSRPVSTHQMALCACAFCILLMWTYTACCHGKRSIICRCDSHGGPVATAVEHRLCKKLHGKMETSIASRKWITNKHNRLFSSRQLFSWALMRP